MRCMLGWRRCERKRQLSSGSHAALKAALYFSCGPTREDSTTNEQRTASHTADSSSATLLGTRPRHCTLSDQRLFNLKSRKSTRSIQMKKLALVTVLMLSASPMALAQSTT